jgi:hypothetical protein
LVLFNANSMQKTRGAAPAVFRYFVCGVMVFFERNGSGKVKAFIFGFLVLLQGKIRRYKVH